MSYDLHLIVRSSGTDLLQTRRADLASDNDELNPGPPVPEKEERKRNLADRLLRANPDFEEFAFGFAEIANAYGCTESEARERFRHIELNGPDDDNGIQITLYDDSADIAVPYWHDSDAAHCVFEEVWQYLTILAEHGGFEVYDPQLDRMLDLANDRGEVTMTYSRVMDQVGKTLGSRDDTKKPWWKFW